RGSWTWAEPFLRGQGGALERGRRDDPDGLHGLRAGIAVPVRRGALIGDGIARSELVPDAVQVHLVAAGQDEPELLAGVGERGLGGVVAGWRLDPDGLERAVQAGSEQLVEGLH